MPHIFLEAVAAAAAAPACVLPHVCLRTHAVLPSLGAASSHRFQMEQLAQSRAS